MDGVLIIDKPAGLTSHDVVNRVRRILGTRRVGHTGTLDPFATGVLVLCAGRATRLSQFLTGSDKSYRAVVRLGFATDTQDATGKPITPVRASDDLPFSSLQAVVQEFIGRQQQTPPMYSAKKVGGVALHRLARRGAQVERQPVEVEVFDLRLDPAGWLAPPEDGTREFALEVHCSAGTYVRTLAHDIGAWLGCGAHLTALRRTAVGRLTLAQALTLEALEAAAAAGPAAVLRPMTAAVEGLPAVRVSAAVARRVVTGQPCAALGEFADGQAVQVIAEDGALVGVARFRRADKGLHPWVVVADASAIKS